VPRLPAIGLGLVVEGVALLLIPLVLLRRREPGSTVAWILALVFLPGVGAALFLLFGRDRVRLPVRHKAASDKLVSSRRDPEKPLRLAPRARELALEALPSPIDRELFRVGAALAHAEPTTGNAAELLVDGDAAYDAIGRAIDAAEHHVHAEYYLVRRDATAAWFRDRLAATARRGVDVKLLLDGYGSLWVTRRWLRPLLEAGGKVAYFLPARLLLLQPMNLRNHRKIVVVDGDLAFTGGINVGDEYRGRAAPWRDTHLSLEGPAARQLAHVFAEDWSFATKEHVDAPDDEPGRPRGDAVVSVVKSGPDIDGPAREAIHRLFFAAITLARSRVYVTTPYFVPDRAIVVALQTAALRGVDVRVLLPSRSNHAFVFQAARSFYEELLEAGVALYEYGPGMIHAKTMVVDGAVSLVGSANMDLRSFRLNFEVHTVLRDPATAARLEACFEADLAVSRRIDLASFRRRPVALKVVEGAARLVSPLM
jgi:cardiolipin synthase